MQACEGDDTNKTILPKPETRRFWDGAADLVVDGTRPEDLGAAAVDHVAATAAAARCVGWIIEGGVDLVVLQGLGLGQGPLLLLQDAIGRGCARGGRCGWAGHFCSDRFWLFLGTFGVVVCASALASVAKDTENIFDSYSTMTVGQLPFFAPPSPLSLGFRVNPDNS